MVDSYRTGWIAGDNATATGPADQPTDMNIEFEVGAQRMLNHLSRRCPQVAATLMRLGFAMSGQRRRFRQQRGARRRARRQGTPRTGNPARFAPAFRAANTLVLPILKSPAHPVLSGRLIVLEDVGGKTGQRHTFPVGYFAWDGDDVLGFGSGKWPGHVRRTRSVRLLIGGRGYPAKPDVIVDADRKADLLAEFTRRHGPRAAQHLMLGLPGDRPGSRAELLAAAGTTTITRFARTCPPD